MHKMFITVVGLMICAVEGNAAHLNPHAIICLNPDTSRQFVALDKQGDYSGVLTYFEQAEQNGVCVEAHRQVHIITAKNLGGGVSKIFIKDPNGKAKYAYAITKEIQK